MNEAPDPLETELSGLRPHELSPALRRRLSERLAETRSFQFRRFAWLALAGGVAAACLTAVLLWRGTGRHVEPEQTILPPQPPPPALVVVPASTLLYYQIALARSPEELYGLLDKDALAGSHSNTSSIEVRAFTRSDADLQALLGDD
jgi:hypothetical protein